LIYNEPRDWLLPARQYLGAVQLKLKKYEDAEKTFNADLVINPLNGWSQRGLVAALRAKGKNKEANQLSKNFNIAAGYKDFNFPSAVY